MRSNYKALGDYIREVNTRNTELKVERLLGVSIQKELMPSIANTIGTDMANYKILKRHQFAYGPVTSRNGDKISIALLEDYDEAIISQAYTSFEIIDTNKLHPEYLMMWFRRPEFDRYARYMSHGSAREVFGWDELCNTLLPIPSHEKQREIVDEYKIVKNRIDLNNQLIKKLEETAQAIYKQWFVDFEFPDENGNPYKSSGGKMVWNEELEKEIPEGWEYGKLSDVSQCLDFRRKPLSEIERMDFKGDYPYYGAMGIVDFVKEYIFDGEYILFSEDGVNVIDAKGHPSVFLIWGKFWVNNHAHVLDKKNGYSIYFLLLSLKNANVSDIVTGAAQPKINQENMNSIRLIIPDFLMNNQFNALTTPIYDSIKICNEQIVRFIKLKNLLLSRLTTFRN